MKRCKISPSIRSEHLERARVRGGALFLTYWLMVGNHFSYRYTAQIV